MIKRSIHWVKKKFTTVMELRDDKRSIAAGAAIGFFWGFTPLFGFKTLLAFSTAWITRTNKIAAVAAVALHDIALPLYPFFLGWSYELGNWITGNPTPLNYKKLIALLEHPSRWWRDLHLLSPVLLGSVLLALPPAIACYFVVQYQIDRLARKEAEQEEVRHHQIIDPQDVDSK